MYNSFSECSTGPTHYQRATPNNHQREASVAHQLALWSSVPLWTKSQLLLLSRLAYTLLLDTVVCCTIDAAFGFVFIHHTHSLTVDLFIQIFALCSLSLGGSYSTKRFMSGHSLSAEHFSATPLA